MTIIGVIAALTIPTLMKNYEKRQIEVGLAKTYQELNTLMQRVENDTGGLNLEKYNSHQEKINLINTYLLPYIRGKSCNSGIHATCLLAHSQYEKRPTLMAYWTGFILDDGRIIAFLPDINCIRIIVDVNGSKGDAIMGIDAFYFSYINYTYGGKYYHGVFPGGPENGGIFGPYQTEETRINNCKSGDGSSCAYFLMKNNWKFPDDYPIKF